MMASDAARTGLESRLRDFLKAAAPRLRPVPSTGSNRIARLGAFVVAARPYLHPDRPAPPRRVNPTSLGEVLRALRAPLERQRATGRALNVWSAAGLRRDEVRNTAVLAELLRPDRLGSTARAFLAAIIDLARSNATGFPQIGTTGAYRVAVEVCPLGQRDNRVDLVIETDHHLLGIEVKIDAVEGPEQLARYASILSHRAMMDGKEPALIFLSPRSPAHMPERAAHVTWLGLQQAARRIARQHRMDLRASWLLTDFADHVATLR